MDTIVAGASSDIGGFAQDESKILWGNDVILREIASYLTIMDLKRLSYANKYLRDRVRTLYSFNSCASQKVTGEMEIHVFKLSRAIVEVDKLNRETLSNLAQNIFQETKHLELQGLNKLSDTEGNSRAILIVSNCQQLKSLKFETINTLRNETMSFFRDETVRTRIANLRELQIGPTSLTDDLGFRKFVSKDKSLIDGLLTYELFEEITKNLKLIKLKYTEPGVVKNCFHPALLLNNSRETLKELNLAVHFKDLESLHAMKFPNLSKLKLIVIKWIEYPDVREILRTDTFPALVIQFLRNHLSNLIEFQFGASYILSLAPLFELLKQPRFNEKLEVLSLMYRNELDKINTMNWDFLQTISNLRYFELVCLNEGFKPDDLGDFGCFLSMLPANLKSIKFRGFKFARRQDNLQNISNTDYSALLRFKHLTALKIHCPSVLNDHLLQFICKNLTQLKILEGKFTEVTNFGISGAKTGISLANLKNLVELEITTPGNELLRISTEQLVRSVCFSHLVKLTVKLERFKTTLEFGPEHLLKLLNQNPSLEVLNYWSIPWSIRNGVTKQLTTPTSR